MSDLSLEQYKNLAKLGLPQELTSGDKYWGPDRTSTSSNWRVIMFLVGERPEEYYKIPSLEELMGFAKTLDECWSIAPCPNGWVITRVTETGLFIEELTDSVPKQAVYKLIERVEDEHP